MYKRQVVDLDVGTRDLQQCADAVIRLRAEYLYQEQRYEEIHFNFTNGFNAEYAKWREGYRIKVEGNSVSWIKSSNPSQSYEDFRKYLDLVFAYAGTLSLAQELTLVQVAEMEIGDVFIQGGSPGHCVIVVDMAEHNETGEKLFMPAQEIHILKNGRDSSISPWSVSYTHLDVYKRQLQPQHYQWLSCHQPVPHVFLPYHFIAAFFYTSVGYVLSEKSYQKLYNQ